MTSSEGFQNTSNVKTKWDIFLAFSQHLNFMALNFTSSKKLQNHSHCVAPPASSVILLVKQKKWDFCHVSWAFLILHHVGQITQTFGHTICQMSSERRTLLLACHANADQSTKVHFGKNLSGNNLPKKNIQCSHTIWLWNWISYDIKLMDQ